MKYSDLVMDWLVELRYTHCFFVAGGNIMHLLDGARKRMTCVPTVHEVAAGIAVEYFNEARSEDGPRAFALVTAGPGLTNIVTALAGAWLESRELLVLGGQVKSEDLSRGVVRQRGIQEVDGREIATPLCVTSARLEAPLDRDDFTALAESGAVGRKGPVFLEFCLDVQGAPVQRGQLERGSAQPSVVLTSQSRDAGPALAQVLDELCQATRPVLLIGGGIKREVARACTPAIQRRGIPVMTTWNGMDRIAFDEHLYMGRPNTWGQRSANVLLQQADLVVALGTRLGLQQTGFNWREFAPLAKVVQVDIDEAELTKGHPLVHLPIKADANDVLLKILDGKGPDLAEWVSFCREVRALLPVSEDSDHPEGFIDPFQFTLGLSSLCTPKDVFVPCSSGGANSISMQAFQQKAGQICITNKGLASMGYGLSGAIGACIATGRRTVLVEGDGGFAQNLQELGTAAVNNLNLKVFLFANDGYASIRTTQRNYFEGQYLGCDTSTGLGFPDWIKLFDSFGIPAIHVREEWRNDQDFLTLFDGDGPAGFVVSLDPEQIYYPKISSRITKSGSMESNPLHLMSPELPEDVARQVLRYLHP